MPDTSPSPPSLYEVDFYAWANQQAALLRAGRLGEADIANIAEEIESMGRSEKRELVSRLVVLLVHLLKWRYQPALRGPSWQNSIELQRIEISDHLSDNPSLKARLDECMHQAYRRARLEATGETRLDKTTFPETCPWSYGAIMDNTFWPQA